MEYIGILTSRLRRAREEQESARRDLSEKETELFEARRRLGYAICNLLERAPRDCNDFLQARIEDEKFVVALTPAGEPLAEVDVDIPDLSHKTVTDLQTERFCVEAWPEEDPDTQVDPPESNPELPAEAPLPGVEPAPADPAAEAPSIEVCGPIDF